MARRQSFACLLVATWLAAGCGGGGSGQDHGGQSPGPERFDASLARTLQTELDNRREIHGATGIAAAVVVPGHGLWSGGTGMADRTAKAPVTGQTPFAIFSITKTFVAALAVKLAQEGRLRLDDPLGRWLPRWPNAEQITLRQLLNNTSGIDDIERQPAFTRAVESSPRSRWTPQRTLRYVGRPQFAPGTSWQYSNTNFILAGLAIERATRATLADQLRQNLLDPLGLDDVVLQPQERARQAPAHGYVESAAGGRTRDISDGSAFVPYRSIASATWAAGGMVASARSLARWGDALLRGPLLSSSSRGQLLDFVPANELGYDGYGLGVARRHSTALDRTIWGAAGRGPGFGSTLWHLPREGVTIAVLWNDDSVLAQDDIGDSLAKVVLDHRERASE